VVVVVVGLAFVAVFVVFADVLVSARSKITQRMMKNV
jgi:hypothetical protein